MNRIELLFLKFYEETATEAELLELGGLMRQYGAEGLYKMVGEAPFASSSGQPVLIDEARANEMLQFILTYKESLIPPSSTGRILPPAPVRRMNRFLSGWAPYLAASVLIMFAIGAYYFFGAKRDQLSVVTVKEHAVDIPPGEDGAILTLADGTQMVLDSLGNGRVATQNGTLVLLHDGQLSYTPAAKQTGEVLYNTVRTPRGRQFLLVLPDGSRVWMNASSRLTYPTSFTGKERSVEVSGEAFFEVAANAGRPFKVKVNNQAEINVLGTSFNVNAYSNEPAIYTTLLEGAVNVSISGPAGRLKEATLRPGQQAKMVPDLKTAGQGSMLVVDHPDVQRIIAWHRGFFNFEDADLPEVMRMLERWYDIEVEYEGAIPRIRFGGEISRKMNLSGILKALKEMEVDFTVLEGKKIVIHDKK